MSEYLRKSNFQHALTAYKEQEAIIAVAVERKQIVQAYLSGEPIQYRTLTDPEQKWKDLQAGPRWVWNICDYRVKTAPTQYYVVFTNRREDLIFHSEEDAKKYAEAYMLSDQGKTCDGFKIEVQAG